MSEQEIITKLKNNRINRILAKNKVVLRDCPYLVKARPNKVNINAWIKPNNQVSNIGDYLSIEVVRFMCQKHGIDMNQSIDQTKHLYAIGSILLGYQDSTIWGSGFGRNLEDTYRNRINMLLYKKSHVLDIRAVRGPETKKILNRMGIECPEVYGDPAVLLPLFYEKREGPQEEYVVVPHYSKLENYQRREHVLGTFTTNWAKTIDRILGAKLVISSSLHGIIIAEAYGISAIMLNDTPSSDITKYKDWYESTGRKEFPIAKTIEEALTMKSVGPAPDTLISMREQLIQTFPIDLWEN